MFNRMYLNFSCMNFAFPPISTPKFSFIDFSFPPMPTPNFPSPSMLGCTYNFNNFNCHNYFDNSFPSIWDNLSSPFVRSTIGLKSNINDYPMDYPIFSGGNTDVFEKKDKQVKKNEEKVVVARTNTDFDKMLKFVLRLEGGYNPNDCGQAGNKGVQQSTYDEYCSKKGLTKRNVKNITDEEVKDLYYTMFYKASGADNIEDARLALYVFDTAVNMGVSAAKELYEASKGDLNKFESLRIARYEKIATNNSKKQKYLKGWKNRVAQVKAYANKEFVV